MATIVTLQDKDGNTIYPVTSPTALTGGILSIANGGTNASTAAQAITNLGAQSKAIAISIVLSSSGWTEATNGLYTQTSTAATGVTASNIVIVTPSPTTREYWINNGVYCYAQDSNSLSFYAETAPASNITVNVLILN